MLAPQQLSSSKTVFLFSLVRTTDIQRNTELLIITWFRISRASTGGKKTNKIKKYNTDTNDKGKLNGKQTPGPKKVPFYVLI